MQYLKDVGFVIRRINFGEADRFITLFTQAHGKVEVLARGVRKITSRRVSHVELLNLIRFHAVKTRKNYILAEVEIVDTFGDIKKSLDKVSAVFLICELLDKLCVVGQKHEDIFSLTFDTIKKTTSENLREVLFNFQIELLAMLGYWDRKKKFSDEEDVRQFIESIIEKKIKTKIYL